MIPFNLDANIITVLRLLGRSVSLGNDTKNRYYTIGLNFVMIFQIIM